MFFLDSAGRFDYTDNGWKAFVFENVRYERKNGRDTTMKRLIAFCLALILPCCAAWGETASFGSVSFDRNAAYIDLGEYAVGEKEFGGFISFLQEFPNLQRVDMFATQIDRYGVQKLEEALPGVSFGWTLQLMKYKDKHIVRSDAEYFSTLHGVCPNHGNNDFVLMKYCTNLKALDLGHNDLTDLSFLLNMPHLRVLILGENPNLKDIGPLSELQELEYLELFTCAFTDITPLTKLPNLMDLNLANNKVRDWRPLMEMKQLKRLWISGMCAKQMTAAEREELQNALPDTKIVFDGEPTQNGWRYISNSPQVMDPHYEVVAEMAKTNAYIPFADSVSEAESENPQAEQTK